MHIDGLVEACKREWEETVELGVRYARDYLEELTPYYGEYDERELALDYAMERIFECVMLQDAVAYIVASGFTFNCLRDTWESLRLDSPYDMMRREIYERLVA